MAIDVVGRAVPTAPDGALNSSAFSNHTPVSSSGAVSTDLPAAETVQAASRSNALPIDDAQQAQARAAIETAVVNNYIKSKFVYDEKQELVFISVDELTGAVIQKYPNDAVLRDTIYQQASAHPQTDPHLVEKVA